MGGSSKKVTVGYDYYMGAHVLFCRGEIDRFHEMIYGERSAYKGRIDSSQSFYINNPNLFGGRNREGGIAGWVTALFGELTQSRNGYLASNQGVNMPAYRGVFSLAFHRVMWSSMNPYFKSIWGRVTCIDKGWDNNVVWYPEKSTIKRKKGVPVNYAVTVNWAGENIASPQTIDYTLQYRIVGDTLWTDAVSSSFSGGSSPVESNVNNGGGVIQTISMLTARDLSPNFNVGTYSSYSAGVVPSSSRTHNLNLIHEDYEFQVIKTNGSRGNVGLAFGGDVGIASIVDSVPMYFDMNPAHILYKLCTNKDWRVNISAELLDDTVWRATADTLYDEGFGLSFAWEGTQDARDLIQKVLNHINGYFKPNFSTGKIELRLMRDDYDINSLVELNNSNSSLVEYQRALQEGLTNQIVVKFRDDNEDVKTITEDNLAAMQMQGGVIPSEAEYEGVHTPRLAKKLAIRNLRVASSPLAKMTRTCNRVLWNHVKGDMVKITDPIIGITNAPYRIAKIEKGSMLEREITVELIEDVFGLGNAEYDLPNDLTEQYDPSQMLEASHVELMELPYWVVHFSSSEAERNTLVDGYGYAATLVTRNPHGAFTFNYDLLQSLDNGIYVDIADGDYSPTGYLDLDVSHTANIFVFNDLVDLQAQNFDTTSALFGLIDHEIVAVESWDDETREMVVRRGCLDTVPEKHAAGARFMLFLSNSANDDTQRFDGDQVYYKVIPRGTGSLLAEEDAAAKQITFNSRASRPYPPGQFKINGEYYPDNVTGGIEITWAHRDRFLQTVYIVDTTEDSIGPEPGTTYVVNVYDGLTLIHSSGEISALSYSVPESEISAISTLKITLHSVRDAYNSWQRHEQIVTRNGMGFGLGSHLGGVQAFYGLGYRLGNQMGGEPT